MHDINAKAKVVLTEMLETLTEDLKSLGVQDPHNPKDWITTAIDSSEAEPDRNVEADRAEDWGERRATLSLLETRYNNIKLALDKIANGKYGICEVSGETIEADRLEANPAARTCKKHLDEESKLTF